MLRCCAGHQQVQYMSYKIYQTWQSTHKKHIKIPQIPMVVLAVDTIDHLLFMSKGNRWALIAICLHTSYVFAVPIKEKSTENVIQAYLSGILTNQRWKCSKSSVTMGENVKIKMLMKLLINLELRSYSQLVPPQR